MAAPGGVEAAPVQRESAPARRRRRRPLAVTVLVLGLVAVSLMLLDLQGSATGYLRQAGMAVGGPLQSWADSALGAVPDLAAQRQNPEQLQQELAAAQRREAELLLRVDQQAEQLARRDSPAPEQLATVMAPVVAAGPAYSRTRITVGAGRNDGVQPDTAVLSGGALVGRVTEVSRSTATVQLINDADSRVAVRVRDSRELALVSGASQGTELQLELFDPLVQIKPDQRLVTVGSPGGRPFPPGLAVGSVGAVTGDPGSLDRSITVTPAVDLTSLDEVNILLADGDGAQQIREAQ